LIAKRVLNTSFIFSIPLQENTKWWKQQQVGHINYMYRHTLNIERAKYFNLKNNQIALKFGLQPDSLTVYMSNNYQDILRLIGIAYSVNDNGLYREGYGVVDKTIFSVMNNEDFSHDIVHHYSSKVNKRKNRNWITEEGLAYYWGNAYYANDKGEMINYSELKTFFKSYISKHTEIDIYKLFENDTQIFQSIAPEVSTRSVIAAIIVEEIEKIKAIKSIQQLINAGRKERLKSFLRITKKLIGLNKGNFHKKIKDLLSKT